MTADGLSLAATIVLLLPMLYLLVASPTFLLRPLSDPVVARLLRGVFHAGFSLSGLFGALAATAFAVAGRPSVALGIGLVAALALGARRWFARRMEDGLRAAEAGDAAAVRRLRRLHWGGMAYNAAQFAAIVGSIPFLFPNVA